MDPEVKEALEERDQILRRHKFPDTPEWGNFMDGKSCSEPRLDSEGFPPAGGIPQVGIISEVILQGLVHVDVFFLPKKQFSTSEGIEASP
jgi:hypothetical protein